jgi:DnaK suppressor protein
MRLNIAHPVHIWIGSVRRDALALRALTRTLDGMNDDELDLDAIRQELESRRQSTSERVATLAERPELGSAQGFGKRIGDGTTEAISRLTEIGVGRSLETNLARTERALAKLDEGSYGICDACGEAIPPKRLRAMPDSVLCVACAAAERRRHDPRRR